MRKGERDNDREMVEKNRREMGRNGRKGKRDGMEGKEGEES